MNGPCVNCTRESDHSARPCNVTPGNAMPIYGARGLRSTLLLRAYTTRAATQNAILHIPKANVYRFGDPNNARPVFQDLQWTINDGESWAVVGSGSGEKIALFQVGPGPRFQKAISFR